MIIRISRAVLALLVLTCFSAASWAGPVGPEFQVSTYFLNTQERSSVAGLAGGGFVVTWESFGADGSFFGIYAQRYDAAGAPAGGEFKVNKYTAGQQTFAMVAGLADGGFVVVWQSDGQDGSNHGIYGQRYNAAGKRVGKREFRINKTTASYQLNPAVAGLGGGGFVATWQSDGQDGSGYGIYAQRYDAAGDRAGKREFRVNKTGASEQTGARIAALEAGGFVVTWQSYAQDGSLYGVYGQRYDAAGARVGKREFRINKTTADQQQLSGVAGLGDGGFVVTWQSSDQDGSNDGIYGQQYASAGGRVGRREFRINRTTDNFQQKPAVASLGDGGFVAVWQSYLQDGSLYGVYGQRYDAAGGRVGKREFMVNTTTANQQTDPSVAGLGSGGFVATWQSVGQDGDGLGIFGQRFGP